MTTEERNLDGVIGKKNGYRVVGTRPIRHDGVDKVTGRAVYGADVRLPGTLYGRILRSPHAHARIKRIDTTRAERHPAVKAIVTARDLPRIEDKYADLGEGTFNFKWVSDNVLASDKVLYRGHAVAAVAATSRLAAEQAIELIEVEYEPLPAVTDVVAAMAPDSPILHEELVTRSLGKPTGEISNVATHFRHAKGDIERGFAEADVIVEREYRTDIVHQGYIEPQTATALWNADDQITIWTSNQGAFGVRESTASVLALPVSAIRVIPMEIGGGFGGKIAVYAEPVAALLSRKSGRPVRVTLSRSEVFQGTGPAPASWVKIRLGAKRSGRLTAAQADIRFAAGAYPGSAVGAAAGCVFAAYDVPNGQIDGYDVVTNTPKSEAYRAPGSPQAAFAAEQAMDELAEILGIDPLDLRIMNTARAGTRRIEGPVFPVIGSYECLVAAKQHPHYTAPLEGPNRARGVAHGFWFNGGGQSSCIIAVNDDGTANLVEGSTDIGGTRASIAMQAAEVLSLAAEDVHPLVADTNSVGYTGVTGGSRTTFATGIAAIEAARDVLRQMKERAALVLDADLASVHFADGEFVAGPGKGISFRELAGRLARTGGPVTGRASVAPTGVGAAFGTHIVDVEVDPETGKVQILRYTAVQDAGRAIHPSYVEGQMQGGAVQGIGWALFEGYQFDDQGRMLNPTLLDYKLPTSLDVPMIDTVIVEVPNPGHPFGVRGVGEVPIVPPAAAIANAIYRAIGVRLTHAPMTPARILEAMGVLQPARA